MIINKITIKSEGYVYCKSRFYSAQDILDTSSFYTFSQEVNKLIGEIDSGNWAISYLLSMYKHRPEDFVLFDQPQITVNNADFSLNELSKISCYMDKLDPLFSTNDSVKELILKGLEHSGLNYAYSDIKDIFRLDNERVERPLSGVGNEIFRAMAAIGFSHKKEIFCFPWLSAKRFNYYHLNLDFALETLKKLNKVVVIPIGADIQGGHR